ncbi:TIR domain-containing protein [Lysobacter sp. S4-A87]|uniref:TIR domain-containing protein n=1 Tax=Lysobacter sp. S4-A87 TaxID=2925843 RepID=UPI001F53D66D|nr:TIR domain-containing protein [Lysobacter sp. S4-A87]UNK48684.1 TIR domain-containing protein [Lysobacter sp. S4-A87]
MHRPPANHGEPGGTGQAHTVFLSYSRADRKAALAVVRVLENAGYHVWWDGLLEGGERFSHSTETALESARAVVVLWSKTSASSHWVHDEATRGRESGRLVPLSLDGSLPPLGFGQFQAIDVSHVLAKPDSEPMRKLLRAVAALHDGTAPTPAAPRAGMASQTRRNVLIAGGLAMVAAGTGGGIWLWRTRAPGAAPRGANDPRRIAVLPFANLSGDPEQRYFSDGLTSEIRTQLSRNELLQIAGQTSSKKAGDGQDDARTIAKALGVDFLLGGNVQKAGARVKVAAELTDGKTGLSRWANSWERPLADIFAVQSEIGTAVAGALSAEIKGPATSGKAQVGGTTNVAAFDAYLHGRALYEAGIDEESDRRALEYFDRAIALDDRYAGAHAARARALAVIGNLYADHDERVRLYDAAEAAARAATTRAPAFAEGFSALGFALASGKLDMRGAREPFERSYTLAPGDADVLARYATFRSNLRDHTRATEVIVRAATLDRLNARTFRSQGDIRYNAGDHAGAIVAFRKAIELNPTLAGVHASLGFAQLLAGANDDARASFSKERSAVRRLPGLAILAQRAGDRAAAEATLAELVAEYGDKSHYQYAQIHAQWADTAKALASLQAAWELRDGGIMLMYADPLLERLRSTAGYLAIAKAVGFT